VKLDFLATELRLDYALRHCCWISGVRA